MPGVGVITRESTAEGSSSRFSLSRVDAAALVLITAQVAFVAWSTSTTWFKQDDYAELLLASRAGGFPGTLFHEFNGHLIPAVLALVSAVHWLFGMNWSAVVAVTAFLQLAASFLTWRVIRSMFGLRPIGLFLFLVYLTSVLAFQTAMWWCTITLYIPLQIAFPTAMLLLQRALRTRSRIDAALPAVAILVGSLFFEKALTITPFLILLVAATNLVPSSAATARGRLKEAKAPLLWIIGVTIAYGVIYQLITRSSPYRPQFEADRLTNFTIEPLSRVFLPSLTGGPFPLGRVAPPLPGMFNLPSSLQVWLTCIGTIALIAWSAFRFRGTARYWSIFAGFFLVNLLMVLLSGREWSLNPRYYAELLFPTVVLLGLALGLSVIDPPHRRQPPRTTFSPQHRRIRLAIGTAVGLLMIIVAASNMNEMRKVMEPAPAWSYSEQALRSSEALGHPITLIRQFVSGEIINGIFLRDLNYTYVVLQPMAGPWAFADASSDPYMVLEDGTVYPARGTRDFAPIFKPGTCNVDLKDGSTAALEVPGDTYPWSRYGSITTTAAAEVGITVDWNGAPVFFTVPSGTATTLFFLVGGGERISLTATGGDVCVSDMSIGRLEPRVF